MFVSIYYNITTILTDLLLYCVFSVGVNDVLITKAIDELNGICCMRVVNNVSCF